MSKLVHQWNSKNPGHELNERPSIVNQINGNKRYYSALDAELYFGNVFIDDVTDIAYSMSQNTLPIYGFNSYTFDDLAVGNRIVQGQFNINYYKSNFLTDLQRNEGFQTIARCLYGDDSEKKSMFTSDYRKRLNLPLWDKGFDIVIAYGYHGGEDGSKNLNQSKTQSYIVLETVQITGVSSMLNSNGEPVGETYTFMARDIRHVSESGSKEEITDNNQNNSSTQGKYSGNLKEVEMNNEKHYVLSLECSESEINKTMDEGKFNFVTTFDDKTLSEEKTLNASGINASYTFSGEEYKALSKEIKEEELDEVIVSIKISLTDHKENKKTTITEYVKVNIK